MYENKTEYVILNNMLDNVTSPVSKNEGTLIYDALSPVACELSKHYMELDAYCRRSFIQTSWGRFLDLRAMEHGLYRKQASKATVDITFTGADGTVIPAGTLVQSIDGRQFATDTAAVIASATATVTATAAEASPEYNLLPNTITTMVVPINGVSTVTNAYDSAGGGYTEDDDTFKARILDAVRNPGASGNTADYYRWAMEVDGVGYVQVNPLYYGAGTVGVVILNADMTVCNADLIEQVAAHIETERPIGSTVTVVTGNNFIVDISVSVALTGIKTLEEVQAGIKEACEKYMESITFDPSGTVISYQKIGALILGVAGVKDYNMLVFHPPYTSDPVTSSIPVPKVNVPRVGTITVTETTV